MWTKAQITNLLLTNDRALERALVVLHDHQTNDEQDVLRTKYTNYEGFNQADAKRMSSMAQQVLRGFPLTDRQKYWLRASPVRSTRPRIAKYWRQLQAAIVAKNNRLNNNPN